MAAKETVLQFGGRPHAEPAPAPNGLLRRCPDCGHEFTGDARFCPFDGAGLLAVARDAAGDPLVGTVVDARYEVVGVIGEGGMGTVYAVRHRTLGRTFALKALKKAFALDKELGERFIQEAKAAAAVGHPNVVQITDFGQLEGGRGYFVMEMLDGESLSRIIRKGGPLPAARAVRILRAIAEALGAAHEAGVVHRDLKPDNVHVALARGGGAEIVKVLDFGLAKVAGSSKLTRAGMVFGTPHYMSPEQASGDPVDHRADIYALGVVMYEMFTGRVPFEADSYMGVLTKHMYMAPQPPSELIADARELGALEDITLRCLQKKPDQRYATMGDLLEDLDRVVELTDTGALAVRASEAGKPPTPRNLLADELEAPTQEELRLALVRAGIEPRPRGLVMGVVGALALALALGWAFTRFGSGAAPDSAPARFPAAGARVESTAPVTVVAPPPPTTVLPAPAVEPAGSTSPAVTPSAARAAGGRRPPIPAGAVPRTRAKKSAGAGEIVNPWGD